MDRWGKIGESRYNKWCKVIKIDKFPKYLKKRRGMGLVRIVECRLGNELKNQCIKRSVRRGNSEYVNG